MNDEIKEIIDYISDRVIEKEKWNKVKDYITNLQQENEKLKEIMENLTTMTVCGDNKQIKNTAQYKLDIYKSRIDKAIEHIEKHQFIFQSQYKDESNFDNHLLDILKGDSNE